MLLKSALRRMHAVRPRGVGVPVAQFSREILHCRKPHRFGSLSCVLPTTLQYVCSRPPHPAACPFGGRLAELVKASSLAEGRRRERKAKQEAELAEDKKLREKDLQSIAARKQRVDDLLAAENKKQADAAAEAARKAEEAAAAIKKAAAERVRKAEELKAKWANESEAVTLREQQRRAREDADRLYQEQEEERLERRRQQKLAEDLVSSDSPRGGTLGAKLVLVLH